MVNNGVKRVEEIRPAALIRTPAGETVLDMGQNMVGWVRVTVRGSAGDLVHLKHCEVLDCEGNFYSDNIREAKQEMRYILDGNGEEVFEPRFTFQGFRYVKIISFPGEPRLEYFTGVVIHTGMEQTVEGVLRRHEALYRLYPRRLRQRKRQSPSLGLGSSTGELGGAGQRGGELPGGHRRVSGGDGLLRLLHQTGHENRRGAGACGGGGSLPEAVRQHCRRLPRRLYV